MSVTTDLHHQVNKIHESNVIYRCIGPDFNEGVLACGYMHKQSAERSQYDFVIDYYSCFILLRGSGTYITDDGTEFPITAGDFAQRRPGVRHSTRIDGDGQWLEYFFSVGRSVYDYLCKLNLLPDAPVTSIHILPGQLHQFDLFLQKTKQYGDSRLPELLLEAQSLILSCLHQSETGTNNAADTIHKACELLTADYEQEMDFEKLSQSIHMSYEAFRKNFKKIMGVSPAHYRTEMKLKQACYMLDSGISIKEAARMSGYRDVYSFTKQFTKTIGLSPGRYQKGTRVLSC